METGGQGNCPIEISPLGQKAGNFWANCEGQVARPARPHLGATRGHQASVTTVCPKVLQYHLPHTPPNTSILHEKPAHQKLGCRRFAPITTLYFTPGCYTSWPSQVTMPAPKKGSGARSVCPPPSIRKSITSGFVNDSWARQSD